MASYILSGPQKVAGEIAVSGAKNAALVAIAATLLTKGRTTLKRVPKINDVQVMLTIARHLGMEVQEQDGVVELDSTGVSQTRIPRELASKARTSMMFVGPLLARFKEATIAHPGGCAIGRRPIDQFLAGFKALGITVEDRGEEYHFLAHRPQGAAYFFPFVSVTATQALLMTATLLPGVTVLKNAALEPEVGTLVEHLNRCGAKISGAGTSTLRIEGVSALTAQEYTLPPDRLETGMFALLAAATRSPLTITQCNPEHVESLLTIFEQMGVCYARTETTLTLKTPTGIEPYRSPGKVITHEYPGFATDLQPPLTVLLTQAEGLTLVHETIFEGRLFYTDLLNRMGANIILCDPHRALVQGPTRLRAKRLESPDIRAGIAMVIAGLVAQGETVIDNIYQIERGHENLIARLRQIGAQIEKRE